MSKLDEILDKYGEKTLLYEAHDKWIKAEAKAELKSLMLDIATRACEASTNEEEMLSRIESEVEEL